MSYTDVLSARLRRQQRQHNAFHSLHTRSSRSFLALIVRTKGENYQSARKKAAMHAAHRRRNVWKVSLVYIVYNSLFASVHVYKMMLKPFMPALYAGRNVFHRFAIVNGPIRVLNPMRILSALDVKFLQNACADVLRLPRHRPFLRAFPQDAIQNAALPHGPSM